MADTKLWSQSWIKWTLQMHQIHDVHLRINCQSGSGLIAYYVMSVASEYKKDNTPYLQYTDYSSDLRHLCLMTMYVGAIFANHFKHQWMRHNRLISLTIILPQITSPPSIPDQSVTLKYKVSFYSWLLAAFIMQNKFYSPQQNCCSPSSLFKFTLSRPPSHSPLRLNRLRSS